MGGFLSGIFAGSNPTLTQDINNAGNIEGFGTSVGEGDISNASAFNNALLAGNPAETAQILAPQIQALTDQAQQQKQTLAQFGNRSGGNNSEAQTIDDKTRANIDNMISQLTGQAASSDASLGLSTLGLGLNANELQAGESQQQLQNEMNSIFGKAISGGLAAGEAGGIGAGFGSLPGGGGAGAGAVRALGF